MNLKTIFHYYFLTQDFSLNIIWILLIFHKHVDNMHSKEIMSQNLDIGLSFIFISKNGKIFVIFYSFFSTFHKIKTRTYINNLRHGSLQVGVFYKC